MLRIFRLALACLALILPARAAEQVDLLLVLAADVSRSSTIRNSSCSAKAMRPRSPIRA